MTGARIGRHPIHPMLVAIPIGLCTFSFFADLVRLTRLGTSTWFDVALWAIAGGVVGALVAAVPGFFDYLTITDARVRDIAFAHSVTAVLVVGLYALSFRMRWYGDQGWLPVAVSAVGLVLLALVGWLGGEMVYVHGMGMAEAKPAPRVRRKVA